MLSLDDVLRLSIMRGGAFSGGLSATLDSPAAMFTSVLSAAPVEAAIDFFRGAFTSSLSLGVNLRSTCTLYTNALNYESNKNLTQRVRGLVLRAARSDGDRPHLNLSSSDGSALVLPVDCLTVPALHRRGSEREH